MSFSTFLIASSSRFAEQDSYSQEVERDLDETSNTTKSTGEPDWRLSCRSSLSRRESLRSLRTFSSSSRTESRSRRIASTGETE